MTSAFANNAMTVKQDVGKNKSKWGDFLVEDENVPQGNALALKRSAVTAPKTTQSHSNVPLNAFPKVTSNALLNMSSKPISATPSSTFTSKVPPVPPNKTSYQVKRPNSGPSLFTTYEANRQPEPVKKLRMDDKTAPQPVQKGPSANQLNARPNSANYVPPPVSKLASMENLYDTSSFLKPVPPGASAAQAIWNPHILSSARSVNSTTNTNEETKKTETDKQNESKSTGFQSAYDKLVIYSPT